MATPTNPNRIDHRDDNLDPITGEPGAHPVGAGIGAAGGATAGAAVGAFGGPVVSVLGAVVGGIVGGLTGKGFAEGLDPTAEDAYWRAEHKNQDYAGGRSYDDFAPAYRVGYSGYRPDARFDEAEAELRQHTAGVDEVDGHDAPSQRRDGDRPVLLVTSPASAGPAGPPHHRWQARQPSASIDAWDRSD